MAFTSNVQYLWPPNFTEGSDTMGGTQRRIVVKATGVSSDATDASDTLIVDRSDLLGPAGTVPSKLILEQVSWTMDGYDSILLEMDEATDEEILRLSGHEGSLDFRAEGGITPVSAFASAGDGDVFITTTGGAALSNYSIILTFRLKA